MFSHYSWCKNLLKLVKGIWQKSNKWYNITIHNWEAKNVLNVRNIRNKKAKVHIQNIYLFLLFCCYFESYLSNMGYLEYNNVLEPLIIHIGYLNSCGEVKNSIHISVSISCYI